MATTFFVGQDITEITQDQLDRLKEVARDAPLRRARLCLHRNLDDPIHEMVIAFHRESSTRPHRHRNKSESFHVIEGELVVAFFDDDGRESRRLHLGPRDSGLPFLYRLSAPLWHTVTPLSEFVVIHETTVGPFIPEETEYPVWESGSTNH